MANSRVLCICVNYISDEETRDFVQSVEECTGGNRDIFVVSNSPSESLHEIARPATGQPGETRVFVHFANSNKGYFGGAALGLELYLRDNPPPEWVMVSNVDISFPDQDFFQILKSYHSTGASAVLAPDILLQTRSILLSSQLHQNPAIRTRLSRAKLRCLHAVTCWYPLYWAFSLSSALRHSLVHLVGFDGHAKADNTLRPEEIYAPFGACILFHRSYFEAGGTLEYPAFLFGEEIFVAETARRWRLRVVYDPRLKLRHLAQGATRLVPTREVAGYLKESYAYLLGEFF